MLAHTHTLKFLRNCFMNFLLLFWKIKGSGQSFVFFNGLTPIKPRHLLIVSKSDSGQLNVSSELMTSSLPEDCDDRLGEVAISSKRSPK